MTVYLPEGVSSLGKDGWWWIVAVANKAAMTVAEATATSVLQVNLAARPGLGVDGETARVDDKRHGAYVTYEDFGVTKLTMGTITWIDRPQDANAAGTAKHRDLIAEGAAAFMVNRRGLGSASENFQAWLVTQRYALYPVKAGPQIPIPAGDEGGQLEYKQDLIITGPRVLGTVVA